MGRFYFSLFSCKLERDGQETTTPSLEIIYVRSIAAKPFTVRRCEKARAQARELAALHVEKRLSQLLQYIAS